MRCVIVLLSSASMSFYRCPGGGRRHELVPLSALGTNVLCTVGRGLDIRFICPSCPLPTRCRTTVRYVSRMGVGPLIMSSNTSIIILSNVRRTRLLMEGNTGCTASCMLEVSGSSLFTRSSLVIAVLGGITHLGVIVASLRHFSGTSFSTCGL